MQSQVKCLSLKMTLLMVGASFILQGFFRPNLAVAMNNSFAEIVGSSEMVAVNWYAQLKVSSLCPDRQTRFGNLGRALKNNDRACSLKVLKYLQHTLPDSIGGLSQLRTLNLNRLDLEDLPKTIGNLKQLKRLNLRFNRLREVPESIGDLKNLQILDLSGNRIETLPQRLAELKHLKWLMLRHNQLSSSERLRIRKILPRECRIDF